MIERLKLTEAMKARAQERFTAGEMPSDSMDKFEHLLEMPIADMTAIDRLNLMMIGAVASKLNEDARPDNTFGEEATNINDGYYNEQYWTGEEDEIDGIDRDLVLISLAPLNPAIVLDSNLGREADIGMGHFMALRHDIPSE